ncbi:Uncharacterised protein [Burkholderia pseudomallei]|nr:Uncharacterised protein [Burkholderia pseudomallei]CAJ7030108.1 Uncharacterised protein [Burkholderia pseudomallei]CAJ7359713.1 Uncharacterised protein [Burkholderia pseudomallei]CAJ7419027.1 Uncharacterised protein [Burkholderia pseudomallei]
MTDHNMENLRTGEPVRIKCEGKSLAGTVILASSNGRSLLLAFEGILAGHVCRMPVLRDEDGRYQSIVSGDFVEVCRTN